MKPQLADNYDEAKLREHLDKGRPVVMQHKVDGVRGLHITGSFTGRSLKTFKNKALTAFWSRPEFAWLDGELVLPGGWTQRRLCSLTTGLVGRVNDPTVPHLIAFDYLHPDLIARQATYEERYMSLAAVVDRLRRDVTTYVHLMPSHTVRSYDEAMRLDSQWLDADFEGSIIRDPSMPLKEGRSGAKLFLWRIKRFIDFEFIIDDIYEAQENQNEAKINELGHTERSSHKENKVGKGMVGGFIGRMVSDVVHNGEVLFKKDQPVKVGPGKSTHEERVQWWQTREVVGQIGKGKTFPQGVLAKPRMPIFLSLRAEEDMS